MFSRIRHSRRCSATVLLLVFLSGLIAFALARTISDCIWPTTGSKTLNASGFMVDYSNADLGYVMVKAPTSKKKMKLRIKHGDDQYTYDINGNGEYEAFPLQLGSGNYTLVLYENKSGKQYAQKGKLNVQATLRQDDTSFLCPNQYVWYTPDSPAVAKSFELCDALTTDRQKVDAIRHYLKDNFLYDYTRAVIQKDSYLGDVDGVFASRKGLCLDFAVITACMLRVQGIPTKVAVGEVSNNAGSTFHAWNYVLLDGEYVRLDLTAQIAGSKNSQYTLDKIY